MENFSHYNTNWPKKFKEESLKIRKVLQDKVLDIQHIGSTAIPNLSAKPIIDIGVLTSYIEDIPFFSSQLSHIGYDHKPDMSSNERLFFRKGVPVEYHLSITSPKYTFWKRNITFRDYLREHSELAKEYEDLKKKNLSGALPQDLEDLSKSSTYNNGKGDFIQKILRLSEKEIKAIFFDADGVTIRPTEPFSGQYQKKHGVPSDAFLKDFFGGIFHDCTTGKVDLKEVLQSSLSSEWKWRGTVEEFLHEWFSSEHFPNEELLVMIRELREKGIRCFLVTNNEKYRTEYVRKEMGFEALFDGIYSSCDIRHRKPSVEFFTHVLQDIGVSAENVVYFDNEEEIITEAKKMGICGYVYESPEQVKKRINTPI